MSVQWKPIYGCPPFMPASANCRQSRGSQSFIFFYISELAQVFRVGILCDPVPYSHSSKAHFNIRRLKSHARRGESILQRDT